MEHIFITNKYKKHYDLLIEKSKNRILSGNIEKHHILPKSLGGNNSPSNIARLTPREHYIAHLLLVKFTKKEFKYKMVAALVRFGSKINSKQYELLRKIASENSKGDLNCSFNKIWIHDPKTKEIKYVDKNNLNLYHSFIIGLPEQRGGFSKGRIWINNGVNEFMVDPDKVIDGYNLGRIAEVAQNHLKHMAARRHTVEKDREHSEKLLGRKYMFNPKSGEYKKIKPIDIAEYIELGWVIQSKPIKTKHPISVEGDIFNYMDDIIKKFNISPTEVHRRVKHNSPKWINWYYLPKKD